MNQGVHKPDQKNSGQRLNLGFISWIKGPGFRSKVGTKVHELDQRSWVRSKLYPESYKFTHWQVVTYVLKFIG